MGLIALLLLAVLFIIVSTTRFSLHPFLALLLAAFGFGLLSGMNPGGVVGAINEGFGKTIGYIGIVIVAGTIIGTFLEKSGGAFAIAESILKVTGPRQVPLAMSCVGYLISIPVFCDSGFVILSPLNRALSKKAKISLAGSAMALSLGLYATHTMVPPTPGPIAAAGLLDADIGAVMIWGLLVSLIALASGWLFAIKIAARIHIDPEPEVSLEEIDRRVAQAPSTLRSMLPIVVPIVLIVLASVANLPAQPFGQNPAASIVGFIGQPVVALLIGVLLAFGLPKRLDKEVLSTEGWIGQAVKNAATIIIITGAGGAFGEILKRSELANVLGHHLATANLGMWLPFVIAAGIKTAQGSSTVAITTTASLMAPLMESLGFDTVTAKALVVVAIGAGSMVVSHANDSFFWVVTQFSRMDVKNGYRLQTLGTLVEGVTAAVAVWLISLFVL